MKILVAGGAGYIGSQTAKTLAEFGHQPIVLDDLSTGHARNVRWGPFVHANLTDTATVREVLREYAIEAVIHFAASAVVAESVARPLSYFQNNVGGTLSLLDAMLGVGVNRLVFSSTCATYGLPNQVPIPEDHPQLPVNPYGESKLFAEKMFQWIGKTTRLRWVALRYFNAAGADIEGELGEEHDPETHLVPLAIATALGRRDYLEICGVDYPTPDGTAVRDYIHVMDLAVAHVCALRHLALGGESLALNLGTGKGVSVRDVVAMVEKISGRRIPTREAPRRPGDPATLVSKTELANRVLHWQPDHSNMEVIVQTACRWHSRGRKETANLEALQAAQHSL
jgi:UDP-glucose-4-epimerase GalE